MLPKCKRQPEYSPFNPPLACNSVDLKDFEITMRIVYASFGGRGDTQPHIAFAVEVRLLPRWRVCTCLSTCGHTFVPQCESHPPLAPSTRTIHSHHPLAPSPRSTYPPLAPSTRRSRAAGPRRPRGPPVHLSGVPVAGAHDRGAICDRKPTNNGGYHGEAGASHIHRQTCT